MPSTYPTSIRAFIANAKIIAPIMTIGLEKPLIFLIASTFLGKKFNSQELLSAYNVIITTELFITVPLSSPVYLSGVPFGAAAGSGMNVRIHEQYKQLRKASVIFAILPSVLMAFAATPVLSSLGIEKNIVSISTPYFYLRGGLFCFDNLVQTQRIISYSLESQTHSVFMMFIGIGIFAGFDQLISTSNETLVLSAIPLAIFSSNFLQWLYHEVLRLVKDSFLRRYPCCTNIRAVFNTVKELFLYSWPVSLRNLVYFGAYFVRSLLLNKIGNFSLLIDLVATTFLNFIFSLSNGYSQLGIIKTSEAIETRKFEDIPKIVKNGLIAISIINVPWLILTISIPTKSFYNVVSNDMSTFHEISDDLYIYLILLSVSQYIENISSVISATLIGKKDIKVPSSLESFSITIGILIAWLLVDFSSLGCFSIPVGAMLGNVLSTVLMTRRYCSTEETNQQSIASGGTCFRFFGCLSHNTETTRTQEGNDNSERSRLLRETTLNA